MVKGRGEGNGFSFNQWEKGNPDTLLGKFIMSHKKGFPNRGYPSYFSQVWGRFYGFCENPRQRLTRLHHADENEVWP
jgi:hypothetical protein